MNILLVSSEVEPFAKTGGLADVCASLPRALRERGQPVTVIMPAYRQIHGAGAPIEATDIRCDVRIGEKSVEGRILRGKLPRSDVPIFFVDQPEYFHRQGLYGEDGEDYSDNCERFVFFCRAVMEVLPRLGPRFDVVHCNDWQTGLVPAYLKTEYRGVPDYEGVSSLFTIHNLAYQGQFWHWDMLLTGLDWKYFNWQQMEFYGNLNLMKTGLTFADALSTVSPRYAEEIQSAPLGCGLEGVLQHRRDVLTGILNGADYDEWDPATDEFLPANYDANNIQPGKGACKTALQQELGLEVDADAMLIGFIGRMVDQKGVDLITGVLREWVERNELQWAILGTGDAKYEAVLSEFSRRYPRRIATRLEFSNPMAHRIEAGADAFLMPSRYEPSGLNQLYSLRYGTVPIVRATGGLADSITDTMSQTINNGTANGFSFLDYSCLSLSETLRRALDAYQRKDKWSRLMESGMRQDWSWTRSAQQYMDLYRRLVRNTKPTVITR